jgi:hypothetical protein
VQVSKDSIDLGIVVTDEKAALGFYRDQLGLEWEGELPVPGGRMYRLKCGTTVIKLLKLNRTPRGETRGRRHRPRTRLSLFHDLGTRYPHAYGAARGEGHQTDRIHHRGSSGRNDCDGDRSRRQHG